MSSLDAVLTDFTVDIERVEHLLGLIKSFREFGASTPPLRANDEEDSWPTATALHGASALRRTDLPILSGSLQLYLAGRFEFCIRQIVESLADEIAAGSSSFSELPETIQKELRSKTLEVVQNHKRYGYDTAQADAFLEEFVACKSSTAAPLNINSAVLSITDSNMQPKIVADVLKRVGLQDYWKEIGKQATVKIQLQTSSDSETTQTASTFLENIMKERNQVAHPTSSTPFPDPDKVLKAAAFLKNLATTTVALAKVHLGSISTASPTTP